VFDYSSRKKAKELRNSGKSIRHIANASDLTKNNVESLLKRLKRNSNIWCPNMNSRLPLMSQVALEERELQIDRLYMKNGDCIENKEL
jgi:hypothetical protein